IGSIQEFNIYDKALNPADVAAKFAAGPVVAPVEPAAPITMFLDFGNSALTEGPDINGNYWNNVVNTDAGSATGNLVDAQNNPTDVNLVLVTGSYQTNSGALANPDPSLLGDLAVGTATGDYHVQLLANYGMAPISFLLTGLDQSKTYVFSFYAGRDTEEERITQYDIQGANAYSGTLQTSGSGIGSVPEYPNGNDSTILVTEPVTPNENGEIQVTFSVVSGSYGYLSAMKVEAL
ncbi:MAG: hypothetical protein JW715_14880, partial [Sedimentisphaerales bacterium]|nr:hypothetical protein [Sedimentisphaerales bacterium]